RTKAAAGKSADHGPYWAADDGAGHCAKGQACTHAERRAAVLRAHGSAKVPLRDDEVAGTVGAGKISAVDPAVSALVAHLAPVAAFLAAMDIDLAVGADHADHGMVRSGTAANIEVCR